MRTQNMISPFFVCGLPSVKERCSTDSADKGTNANEGDFGQTAWHRERRKQDIASPCAPKRGITQACADRYYGLREGEYSTI